MHSRRDDRSRSCQRNLAQLATRCHGNWPNRTTDSKYPASVAWQVLHEAAIDWARHVQCSQSVISWRRPFKVGLATGIDNHSCTMTLSDRQQNRNHAGWERCKTRSKTRSGEYSFLPNTICTPRPHPQWQEGYMTVRYLCRTPPPRRCRHQPITSPEWEPHDRDSAFVMKQAARNCVPSDPENGMKSRTIMNEPHHVSMTPSNGAPSWIGKTSCETPS